MTGKLFVGIVGLMFLAGAAAAEAVKPVYELGVNGLGCPFCAYGVEKRLHAVKGVDRVEIDLKRGVAAVTMAEGATLDEDTAKQAVEDAGFDLRSFGPVSRE